jgi:cytochrome P450
VPACNHELKIPVSRSIVIPKIPLAPKALPLLGHTISILRDPLAFLGSLPQHGKLVRVRTGPLEAIVVCDPTLTSQILHDDRTYDKGGPVFDRGRQVIGNGLVTCSYHDHRRQRRLIQPAFSPKRIPMYSEVMTRCVSELSSSWREEQTLDVYKVMTDLTSDIVIKTMFADAAPPALRKEALDSLARVFDSLLPRLLIPTSLDRLPLPGRARFNSARRRFRSIVGLIVKIHSERGEDQVDLLSALFTARDSESSAHRLSNTEIIDQAVTFFLAGSETAAAVLAWTLFLLDEHPDVKERLCHEVDAVLQGRAATYADVPKLELTRRIIVETLRLYPPGWLLTRTAVTDTYLGGHPIRAGTIIVYSPYVVHHRSDLYEDVQRFDPDRWNSEQAEKIPRESFIPFGGGARKCIGDNFGITESIIILASIVAQWDLQLLPTAKVRPGLSFTLFPKGLQMRVLPRLK